MIVEDDSAIREMLSWFLLDEGYEVIAACDGDRALSLISERRPDLILLDFRLPGMDGSEFISRSRELQKYKSSPVLLMTASAAPGNVAQGLDICDWIAKPFDLDDMAAQIQIHLKTQRH